ncbi:MAG: hypothetical protein Q4C87_07535 [Actinomycetaceae bacterium]|nr:hypothetical protein [Actinomycetaceae bacterium]
MTATERNSIFTSGRIDLSNFHQVYSACIGPSMVIQEAASEKVVRNRDWFVDFERGTLSFGDEAFAVQFIGSESTEDNTWMWGWNNINGFPEDLISLANHLYSLGESFSLKELTTPQLPLTDEVNAHSLGMIATVTSGANLAYYRGPHEYGSVLMCFPVPEEVYSPITWTRFIEVIQQCIMAGVDGRICVESLLLWNGTPYDDEGNTITAHFPEKVTIEFDELRRVAKITNA